MSNATDVSIGTVVDTSYASHSRSRRRRWWLISGVTVVLILVTAGMTRPDRLLPSLFSSKSDVGSTYRVTPVTLNVTLKEDGEIKAVDSVELKNEVQGQRVTIEWIVEESTAVKKGDLLVKLASDDMKDRVETEEMELKRIAADLENARQALRITQSENESTIKSAEIERMVAELELKRYLEGDYQKSKATAEIAIQQTRTQLNRVIEELKKSIPLQIKGFVPKSDIEELEDQKESLELTLHRNQLELDILEAYELPKNRLQKVSALERATEELDRVQQRSTSREKQAIAKVDEAQRNLEIREGRFERLREQLAKCEIHAPCDGVVQYGEPGDRHRWSGNRIATGEQVYPGQTIITLPDTRRMMVTTRVHEADRHKIKEGLTAIIRVPAVPGQAFVGKLTKIAKFADSENAWLNPNLKEHAAEIVLDENDSRLSPGDTARVEILIEEAPDVLAVPVQCVYSRGAQHFVFRQDALDAEPVEVDLGRTTPTMVEITTGLNAGDKVVMAPEPQLLAELPSPSTADTGLDRPKHHTSEG